MKVHYIDVSIDSSIAGVSTWDRVIESIQGGLYRLPMCEASYATIECEARSAYMALYQCGELQEMIEPLAIPFPRRGHIEVVPAPRTCDEAWKMWDSLQVSLSLAPQECDAAIERLIRKFPNFYNERPSPPRMPVVITMAAFMLATGRIPENDDLDRANCPHAGEIGHLGCGWNVGMNKPQWECF